MGNVCKCPCLLSKKKKKPVTEGNNYAELQEDPEAQVKSNKEEIKLEKEKLEEERKKEEKKREEQKEGKRRQEEEEKKKSELEKQRMEEEKRRMEEEKRRIDEEKRRKMEEDKKELSTICKVISPTFEKIWDTKMMLGIDIPVSFWDPIIPPGWCSLGSYCKPGKEDFKKGPHLDNIKTIIVKNDNDKWFPKPKDYRCIWHNKKVQAKSWLSKPISVWEPIPPDENYISLGYIVHTKYTLPPLDRVRCVHRSLVRSGTIDTDYKRIWTDGGSGTGAHWCIVFQSKLNVFVAAPTFCEHPGNDKVWIVAHIEHEFPNLPGVKINNMEKTGGDV